MRKALRDAARTPMGPFLLLALAALLFIEWQRLQQLGQYFFCLAFGFESNGRWFTDLEEVIKASQFYFSGGDPYQDPSYHQPLTTTFNYPIATLALFKAVGFNQIGHVYLAIGQALLYIFVCIRLFWRVSLIYVPLAIVAIYSAPALLGIVIGNIELLAFALVGVGFMVLQRTKYADTIKSAGIFSAAILKLLPILALPALIWQGYTTKRLWLAIITGLLFGGYAIYFMDNIIECLANTPTYIKHAYGITVPFLKTGSIYILLTSLLAFISLTATCYWYFRKEIGDLQPPGYLWAGAFIYVGTFLIFPGQSYRLIFLLFPLAGILHWPSLAMSIRLLVAASIVATLSMPSIAYLVVSYFGLVRVKEFLEVWGFYTASLATAAELMALLILQGKKELAVFKQSKIIQA